MHLKERLLDLRRAHEGVQVSLSHSPHCSKQWLVRTRNTTAPGSSSKYKCGCRVRLRAGTCRTRICTGAFLSGVESSVRPSCGVTLILTQLVSRHSPWPWVQTEKKGRRNPPAGTALRTPAGGLARETERRGHTYSSAPIVPSQIRLAFSGDLNSHPFSSTSRPSTALRTMAGFLKPSSAHHRTQTRAETKHSAKSATGVEVMSSDVGMANEAHLHSTHSCSSHGKGSSPKL